MSDAFSEKTNEPNFCYNCNAEIKEINQLNCPNCGMILNPNNHVKWRNSFLGFLCLLLFIPILIAFLIYFLI
ncbi:MAG: hypothetical protein EU539_06775 [Promethearchaeota archaeon]|nr:MAG: hypothetical protein EU539_06775 [Candidatus Lokiarchaeota archaeon]